MKTTVEISDSLLREVRKVAVRKGITLRELMERGLRKVVEDEKRREPFKLRDASFKGKGLQPEFQNAAWDEVRGTIYKDRGA